MQHLCEELHRSANALAVVSFPFDARVGGHFDNLSIYEMIRRRCRHILVVDADADEKFDFEDLARLVRFAGVDLDAIPLTKNLNPQLRSDVC